MMLDPEPRKPATVKDLEEHLYHIRRHMVAVERHTSFWPSVWRIVTAHFVVIVISVVAWCAVGGLLMSAFSAAAAKSANQPAKSPFRQR